MSLLQGAQDKRAIKNASWALANLAKSNSDNKAAIREAKGIQVLPQLLCLCLLSVATTFCPIHFSLGHMLGARMHEVMSNAQSHSCRKLELKCKSGTAISEMSAKLWELGAKSPLASMIVIEVSAIRNKVRQQECLFAASGNGEATGC